VHGPCTWSVRDRVHGRVYGRVDGRVYGPCARRCTYRVYGGVHGRSRRVRTVYGQCTPACNGRVHSASTAVYRVHLHGPVLCTRLCLRPVYTAAHGRVQTVYTAVHGPRTWSVRDPITAVYAARVHGIVRTINRVHAVSINETNFAQHKPSTVFMNRSS